MTHITVSLPQEVAQQYYNASAQLSDHLTGIADAPDPRALMRFVLASYSADQIAQSFDRTLRNLTGAPNPDEPDIWVFSPEFENAP